MGFMDKAKKMAEQAQAKIDEAQKQFNAGQQGQESSGPSVEYDQHGRPVPADTAPPHGDPVAGSQAPPSPPRQPAPPPTQPAVPSAADEPQADAGGEDRNHPSYAPPKLSSGDPLAG